MTQRRHTEDELKQKREQQRETDEQKKEAHLLLEGVQQYCRQLQKEGQELVESIQALRARSAVGRLLARIGGTSEQGLHEAFQQKQNEYKQSYEYLTIYETEYHDIVKAQDALRISIETLSEEAHNLSLEHQRVTPEAREITSLNTHIDDERAAIRAYEQHIATLDADEQQLRLQGDLLQGRLDEIEQAQGQIVGEVMTQARLIGVTLAGLTTNPFLRDRLFDAVLIDEASMASLVHVVVAAAHARSHVAIFGDPLQLAPVIQIDAVKAPHAFYWLGTNLFTYRQVTLQESTTQSNRVVLLSQQSRMQACIAEPISRFIYQGLLHNRLPRQTEIEPLAPHPEWPLMLIDTGDVDRGKAAGEARLCRASRPPRSSSKVNRYHVACIVQLVRLLASQSAIHEQKGPPRIGIITPYGAQKAALRRALQEERLLHLAQVATIHGVQSAEFACVIFDTTEGYGVSINRFTSSSWGQHGIPHSATCLLNVAHSRVQEKLIYLANLDYIHADAYRRAHLLTRLVDAAAANGCMDSSQLFTIEGQTTGK